MEDVKMGAVIARVRRVVAPVVALLAFALVVSGCSRSPDNPPRPPGASSSATVDVSAAVDGLQAEGAAISLAIISETLEDGVQELTAEGVLNGNAASVTIDASAAPNAAGFYGHYDSIESVFRGTDGYFAVVPGNRWLHLDLSSASPFVGADVARLRELMLVNPALLLELLRDAPAALAGDAASKFELSPAGSELMVELKRKFGITSAPVTVSIDPEGRIEEVQVEFVYEVIKGTEARNTVSVTMKVKPPTETSVIKFPEPSMVQEF